MPKNYDNKSNPSTPNSPEQLSDDIFDNNDEFDIFNSYLPGIIENDSDNPDVDIFDDSSSQQSIEEYFLNSIPYDLGFESLESEIANINTQNNSLYPANFNLNGMELFLGNFATEVESKLVSDMVKSALQCIIIDEALELNFNGTTPQELESVRIAACNQDIALYEKCAKYATQVANKLRDIFVRKNNVLFFNVDVHIPVQKALKLQTKTDLLIIKRALNMWEL